MPDPLRLELRKVGYCHVGAGNHETSHHALSH